MLWIQIEENTLSTQFTALSTGGAFVYKFHSALQSVCLCLLWDTLYWRHFNFHKRNS